MRRLGVVLVIYVRLEVTVGRTGRDGLGRTRRRGPTPRARTCKHTASATQGIRTSEKSFSPIRAVEQLGGTRNGIGLIRIRLNPDATGMPDTQQVINDLKAFIVGGVVGAGNVHEGFELAVVVVAQKLEDGEETRGCDIESELVAGHGELLDELGQAGEEVGPVGVQLGGRGCIGSCRGVFRSWFCKRRYGGCCPFSIFATWTRDLGELGVSDKELEVERTNPCEQQKMRGV
jgi:hypothetical protein